MGLHGRGSRRSSLIGRWWLLCGTHRGCCCILRSIVVGEMRLWAEVTKI